MSAATARKWAATVARKWAAPVATLCAVLTLAGLAVAAALDSHQRAAVDHAAIQRHGRRLDAQEERIGRAEGLLVEIRTDVRWMREQMEAAP